MPAFAIMHLAVRNCSMLGNGVMAAHATLTRTVQVQVLAPQLFCLHCLVA